jgi:hypothetical protein
MEITKQHSLKEHALKCPICYETFSNIHKPLLIPCGHTICSNCLEQLKKMSKEDEESGYTSPDGDLDVSLSEDSSEEESEDYDDDEDGDDNEEEEEESEDTDDARSLASNRDVANIEIVEPKVESGIHKEANENRKIRLKCSICRTKMRIYPNDIIVNKNVLQFIQVLDDSTTNEIGGNVVIDEKVSKVFCRHCKVIDTESGHLQLHHQHKEFLLYLNNSELENLKNTKIIDEEESNNLNLEIVKLLEQLITAIFNNEEFKTSNQHLSEYFKMYSRITYLCNKSFKNFTNLYLKFESFLKEKKLDKAEQCLETSSDLAKKYYNKLEKLITMEVDINKKLQKDKSKITESIMKYLNYLVLNKHTKLMDYSKKFTTFSNSGDNSIFIFDLRIMADIYIPYDKIFEKFNEEKGDDYDYTKNYSEFTDIDNDGRYLFILGKQSSASKKFRVFDLLERKIITKPNIPQKLTIFDKYFYNKRLFILGGRKDNDAVKDCYYYDTEGDYWFDLPELHLKRYRKSIAMYNNAFYVFGGLGADENNYKFEKLDLNLIMNLEWKLLEIKNYRSILTQPLYGFVSDTHLLILGGQEVDNYSPILKGHVINIQKEEAVEEFEINKAECYDSIGIFNYNIIGTVTDGTFHRFDVFKNLNKLKTLI